MTRMDSIFSGFCGELEKLAREEELFDHDEHKREQMREAEFRAAKDSRNIDPLGLQKMKKQKSVGEVEDRELNRKKRQSELDAEDDSWTGDSANEGA